ncbi:hypothetical protein FRB90_002200 [Tulasnella sp. 427]|nr:hypothetical protein FRB90_002200 [Tulasnella sp. 427]
MGRPTFGLIARFSEDSAKPTLRPRPSALTSTTFPALAPKKVHPPRATSASGGNFRPPTRIVAFATAADAASTAAASPKPGHLSSPPPERPTTPPLPSQPVSPALVDPSKPPTIGMSLSPRKRVNSVHTSRANLKDAGTTPARFAKARVVTSPAAPPPPMPSMPTAHVKNNVVLGQSRIGAPSVL